MITSTHDAAVAPPERSSDSGSRYLGGSRGLAVATLTQAIMDQAVLVLLTGPAGVGKTVVLDATLAALAAAATTVTRLSNPGQHMWTQRDLACQLLGEPIDDPASQTPASAATQRELAALIATDLAATAGDTRIVTAIDDAHTLTDDAVELLLLLASPLRGIERPPQLILSGRGEFWERDRSELLVIARLAERVVLATFDGPDAMDYSAFRLRRISGSNPGISPDALPRILAYSGGLPALIDEALAAANSIRVCRASRVLTDDIVEAAIASMALAPGEALVAPPMTPEAEWVAPPRPIDPPSWTNTVPPPIGDFMPLVASVSSAPDPSPPLADRDREAIDPEPSVLAASMLRSPSPRAPAVDGNALMALEAERPASVPAARVVPAIAPKRRRLGRKAAVAANFVILGGGLLCAILVPRTELANAVRWPWWDGASKVLAVRPMIPTSVVRTATGQASAPPPAAVTSPATAARTASDGGTSVPTPASPAEKTPALARSSVAAAGGTSTPDGPPNAPAAETDPTKKPGHGAGPPPASAALSRELVTFLLARGDLMLQQGDVRSARLFFEQAAEAGSQPGAIGAAKTYDPAFLATIDPPAPAGDVARAIKWYRMASTTFGDQYASERLKALEDH